MDAAGVIAYYVLDDEKPLTAESAGNTTFYLYGLGAIGEKTTDWNFSLPDGTNTPRQLTNAQGEITLSSRYTPWGDSLELHGTGNFTFGYLGGVLDATTGLLYVGSGQYYDPATGRFLTRNVNPNSTNPYVPWNPIGAILGPLGLIALIFGRKKKGSKTGTILVLLLVTVSVGMTIASCSPPPNAPAPGTNQPPTSPVPNQTPIPTGPSTSSSGTAGTATPPITLTLPECPTPVWTPMSTLPPTSTPTPNGPTKLDEKVLSAFGRGITGINGLDFYKWYKETLYPQTSEWWWARFGYDGDGFTITDAFAVVYVFETQNNWSNQYIPEASVPGMCQ